MVQAAERRLEHGLHAAPSVDDGPDAPTEARHATQPYRVPVPAPTVRTQHDRQLALLITSAVDYAMFLLDLDGHVQTWNPGAQRMKGWTESEIVGRHFSIFYTEEDRERDHPSRELEIATQTGRYEEEGWRIRKDGSRFWANVVITALRDETGTLVGFGEVSRDLTARRLSEELTRAKANQLEAVNQELGEYRRLVSSVRDYAIFMLDPSGYIQTWNAGARHLKGYEPEEAIGRHFSMFYSDEDRERRHPEHELELAVRDGRYAEEGWRYRKDRSRFWASVTITAVRDEHGMLTGFAKITRDLTDRREAEQALHAALDELRAANAELDRFAAVAAHDLTDPLRTITGFAELLTRRELGPDELEYAQHIRESGQRLMQMLRDLLTFARAGRETEVHEPVPLADVVSEVLRDLAGPIAERGAEVDNRVPEHAVVTAVAGDVRLILQNLVSNAVKFGTRPAVTVGAEQADSAWRITVDDDGPGVPEEDRERIFGAFERAERDPLRRGYGLGLAICARLAERHGGEIGMEPRSPRGSRFWVTLIRRGSRPPASSPPSHPPR
jgi:PAS domain S-box-containing protein